MHQSSWLEHPLLERLDDQALTSGARKVTAFVHILDRLTSARELDGTFTRHVLGTLRKAHGLPARVDRRVVVGRISRGKRRRYVNVDPSNSVDHLPESGKIDSHVVS